ncbi:MAG TPA: ABC-type transport auxiliary lipoprotein family protein [Opitutaceae bacterium]
MKTSFSFKSLTARTGLGLAVALAALAPSGCSIIPEATSDPTRFYVLSTQEAPAAAAASVSTTVYLRPIEMASYLRGRAMVVRRSGNEIEFREFARWGESLDFGIARLIREELLSRGAASAVSAGGARRDHVGPDALTLSVRVLACEGTTQGAVVFRAAWDLTTSEGKVIGSGDYRPTDLRWDGKSEAALAGQLSQAVIGLAGEIAAGVAKKPAA